MAAFNIKRLTTLPGVLEVSTMYITKNATNEDLVDLTFVGNTTADVRHTMGQADVDTAVDTAIANLTAEQIPDLPGTKITSAVATASALATARNINGVPFNGTSDITVPAVDTVTPRVAVSDIGVTVASLVAGKIPVSQLPNGLDNLDTFPTREDFPATGSADTLYIAADTNMMYRWADGEPGDYIMIPAGGGVADTAVKLATPRNIALSGAVTGTIPFDGSQNVTIVTTLTPLTADDIPAIPGSKVNTAVASADKLSTPRTIALTGSVTGSGSFDGSGNLTITTTGGGSVVTGFTGTAVKMTYADGVAKTDGGALVAADIPNLPGSKITSAVALATALDVTAEW